MSTIRCNRAPDSESLFNYWNPDKSAILSTDYFSGSGRKSIGRISILGNGNLTNLVAPPSPKAPKIKDKYDWKQDTETIAVGFLKIALKLAPVMAHKALDWLYDVAIHQ